MEERTHLRSMFYAYWLYGKKKRPLFSPSDAYVYLLNNRVPILSDNKQVLIKKIGKMIDRCDHPSYYCGEFI